MPRRPKPLTISLHALAEIEVRVLEAVCRFGPYNSAVSLSADLWRGPTDDWHVANADSVEWIVYSLCDQGFLILREHTYGNTSDPDVGYAHGLRISYIRATREAFDLLDFPPMHYAVGSRLSTHRDAMIRPGDTTEFRFHDESAKGGSIERMPIEDHVATYPDHPHHRRQMREVRVIQAEKRRPLPEPDWGWVVAA